MTNPLPRRRLLAAAAPGLLAGCLVESNESADAPEDGSASADGSEADGQSANADEPSVQQVDDANDTPDDVGPNGSGLVVTAVDVRSVTDDGYETTVQARLTVENRGRFTYGTVELRVDAYASRPSSHERVGVGYEYVTERFRSNDRFGDGTRQVDVTIVFRSRETRARPDPDWYEVGVAIRRAEPV